MSSVRTLLLIVPVALALACAVPAQAGSRVAPRPKWGWGTAPVAEVPGTPPATAAAPRPLAAASDSTPTDSAPRPPAAASDSTSTDSAPRPPASASDSTATAAAPDDRDAADPDSREEGFAPGDSTIADSASVKALASGGGTVDYLWVLRSALIRPASVDSVVSRARAMGVRALLVQVVGRGDAYYDSAILPHADALEGAPRGFDPLERVVERAHAAGLEVHAWMNCMLVWSSAAHPRDPRHVLNEHPEWVAMLADGRRMTLLSDRECRARGVEGVFLSPAHPRVRAWLASIAQEIASRYPVDGIHLDYIRQPGVAVGYDPTTRARFAMETGVDPDRFELVPPAERAAIDSAWSRFQRDQVTLLVRAVRDSLAREPRHVTLSAAVIADTVTAERANAQCWRAWVRDGVVDRVFPMCYAPSVQRVMDQLVAMSEELGVNDRVVPGIAVFNTSASIAAIKIRGARTIGFPSIALYSYDSLFAKRPGRTTLRESFAPYLTNRPDGRTP